MSSSGGGDDDDNVVNARPRRTTPSTSSEPLPSPSSEPSPEPSPEPSSSHHDTRCATGAVSAGGDGGVGDAPRRDAPRPPAPAAASTARASSHPDPDLDPPPFVTFSEELSQHDDDVILAAWCTRNRPYLTSVNFGPLRRPPLLASIWGCSEAWWRARVMAYFVHASRRARRRLTEDETALYTAYAARGAAAASYDRPIAAAAVAAALYRGWDTHRFPFYSPRYTRFNPDLFPSPRRPLLRGRLAGAAWHGVRCGAYGLLAYGLHTWAGLGDQWQDYWMAKLDEDALVWERGLKRLCEDTGRNMGWETFAHHEGGDNVRR